MHATISVTCKLQNYFVSVKKDLPDVITVFSKICAETNLTCLFLISVLKNDVEDMLDLSEMRQDMMDRVTGIMNKANEYRSSFDAYAYLWLDDRNEFMRQFLLYNHVLTAEEIEAHAEEGVPENPPTLAQFKEQVK